MKRMSQREGRRLQKQVRILLDAENAQRRRWAQEWVGGVEIARATFDVNNTVSAAVRTAHALKHAVVVVGDEGGLIRFMALPLPTSNITW